MEKLYPKGTVTVEYDIIRLDEDYNVYSLSFYPGTTKECVKLLDAHNPSVYLSILIFDVWAEYTSSGKRHFSNFDYGELCKTCIALLYARGSDVGKTNLALDENGKFYKYGNSISGMDGDLKYLYTQLGGRIIRDEYRCPKLLTTDYFVNSDCIDTKIVINWI